MSELEELVRSQWQEMYKLGRRHGASEELLRLSNEIQAEFTRNQKLDYYTAAQITRMIAKRIGKLEDIDDKALNHNSGV